MNETVQNESTQQNKSGDRISLGELKPLFCQQTNILKNYVLLEHCVLSQQWLKRQAIMQFTNLEDESYNTEGFYEMKLPLKLNRGTRIC